MSYRSEIAELAKYCGSVLKINYLFKHETALKVDISDRNPRIFDLTNSIDKIEKELPLNASASFNPKKKIYLLFVKIYHDVLRGRWAGICRFEVFSLKPNYNNAYQFSHIGKEERVLVFIKGESPYYPDYIDMELIISHNSIEDIINFAQNYSILKEVLKPEHFKPYEKLWKLLFGDVR